MLRRTNPPKKMGKIDRRTFCEGCPYYRVVSFDSAGRPVIDECALGEDGSSCVFAREHKGLTV